METIFFYFLIKNLNNGMVILFCFISMHFIIFYLLLSIQMQCLFQEKKSAIAGFYTYQVFQKHKL